MKKRLLGLLLGVMLVFGCVGCGAESKTTEPTETATATTTEESTTEQAEGATATSEETVEPTPEVKEEPSEETTAETEPETTEPTPETTAEPEPTEEPTPEPEPQAIYTYTDMSATMYAQQTVNVRDLPDTSGNKIGSLSTNDEIIISGQCNETSWYRFEYNDSVAFVSNKYVSENKVEIQQAPADNSTANSGSTASNWADSYPKNQWIDMDEYFFYIANSQPEANQVYGDYMITHTKGEDCHIYHPDLEVRYPDRRMYIMAFTTEKGNVPVCIVSTYINEPWYRPKFIWE